MFLAFSYCDLAFQWTTRIKNTIDLGSSSGPGVKKLLLVSQVWNFEDLILAPHPIFINTDLQ